MQIFNRRVLVLETNNFVTKALLVRIAAKKAKILKKYKKVHTHFEGEWISATQLETMKKALAFIGTDVEDYVVINFPFERVISSVETMPNLAEEQLKNAIKFKMSEEFNIPVADFIIEVAKASRGEKPPAGNRHLAFATRKSSLEEFLSKVLGISKVPEPDILIPDSLKYLELFDARSLRESGLRDERFSFLICMDLNYSVLFIFKNGYLWNLMEIPYSLKELIGALAEKSIDVDEVVSALVEGSEIGSLSYVKEVQPVLDQSYQQFLFEAEKSIRNFLIGQKVQNPLGQIHSIFVTSLNNRLTMDLEFQAHQMRLLNGMRIQRIPLKEDFPTELDSFRTVLGLAYRGVRQIGRCKFVQ
ncbi:MAG TPA: hypothetical protein P5560_00460 [Thermotogota bacterium]|nr:hypothetical protein [Thermotogota bacterium]HRW91404.1 hypothetical protein [Thermotogota bacterium]